METIFLEIKIEKRLYSRAAAMVDEAGFLTIIQDVDKPEAEQQYVYLDKQATRALRNLLNSSETIDLIK